MSTNGSSLVLSLMASVQAREPSCLMARRKKTMLVILMQLAIDLEVSTLLSMWGCFRNVLLLRGHLMRQSKRLVLEHHYKTW